MGWGVEILQLIPIICFIGFSLLAHGICDKLTVADVNPEAVECCKKTVKENKLERFQRMERRRKRFILFDFGGYCNL